MHLINVVAIYTMKKDYSIKNFFVNDNYDGMGTRVVIIKTLICNQYI